MCMKDVDKSICVCTYTLCMSCPCYLQQVVSCMYCIKNCLMSVYNIYIYIYRHRVYKGVERGSKRAYGFLAKKNRDAAKESCLK